MRWAIGKHRPDILQRYEKIDSMSEDQIRLLQDDIYNITRGDFGVWGIGAASIPSTADYFKGSHFYLDENCLQL